MICAPCLAYQHPDRMPHQAQAITIWNGMALCFECFVDLVAENGPYGPPTIPKD